VEGKGVTGILTSSLKQTEPSAPPKEKTSNTFFTRIPLDLSKMPPSPVAVKVIPKTGMGEIDWKMGCSNHSIQQTRMQDHMYRLPTWI
jgi:hypothetical protein